MSYELESMVMRHEDQLKGIKAKLDKIEHESDISRRLYETECKDHAFMRKTMERVIRERDRYRATLEDIYTGHMRDRYRATLEDIYTGHILSGAVQEKIEEALNFNTENAKAHPPAENQTPTTQTDE